MAILLTDDQIRDTRSRICRVAERQFAERGLQDASLRSIAAEMGWTAASLYRYFDNKDALLAATRAAALDRFSDRIEAAYGSTPDLWDRSRAIAGAYIGFAMDEPNAYQLIFAFHQPRNQIPPELAAAEQRSISTVTDYVRDMVDAGLLEGDPDLLGRAYWVSIHGLITLTMAGRIGYPDQFEALRHEIARLITRGARPVR
jgi:AcrR family transcriptional regulator